MLMKVLSIEKILNLEKWQQIQDSLSKATKLAIITVDYKGVPITAHSCCNSFCSKVRSDPDLRALCQKCDSRAGLEAVRSNEPFIYLCHFGIVDVAIPFTVYGNYIGALMAGQVRLPANSNQELEHIIPQTVSPEQFSADYNLLPEMSYTEIQLIADSLNHICNYIIEEALDKDFLVGMLNKQSGFDHLPVTSGDYERFKLDHFKQIKKEMAGLITNSYISQDKGEIAEHIHPLIKPAIDYLYNNKSTMPSLKDMSKICRLSPSYFSKMFSSEQGQSYTDFLTALKITWAKELLENTDQSITQISENLGFSDEGYFIKKFKKAEGVTPLVYRKYCRKQSILT
ncbi:MAG: helix-turn-helix domain-containing protein [Clostridia bacterium]|nr:helix-turn-helix domain-containing protein [Clostridia bacterium]